MSPLKKSPLIVILGPTASGKSALAVKLAKRFKGEIVSADSRHIYRGLNIASGKIKKFEMKGVPHRLLDIASPKKQISPAEYKKLAEAAINAVHERGKLPFLVGGTGFYIDAVARGLEFPEVKPNLKLRKLLSQKSKAELFNMLKHLDAKRAASIDKNNPRRLIRAIEIAKSEGNVPKLTSRPRYLPLFLGLMPSRDVLQRNIKKRTEERLERGMIQEVKNLRRNGVTLRRLKELGLEYGILADYLKSPFPKEELIRRINAADWHYAKRQLTWFKRYLDIHWIKNEKEAAKRISRFLKNQKVR